MKPLRNKYKNRRGLAAPVSLLLILFSLTMVSTVAYSFSLSQIENRKQDLNLNAAELKNLDLEASISNNAWKPGSIMITTFSNYGGQFKVETTENHLQLNATMNTTVVTLYDNPTGRYIYELPSTVVGHYGRWFRGDERAIVNQTASLQAQVNVGAGDEFQELITRYRPTVSSSLGDLTGGRRVNKIRVYIINLNGSNALLTGGEFRVKATVDSVTVVTQNYDIDAAITSIKLSAELAGITDSVDIPITSGPSGSTIKYELVISNVILMEVIL